MSSAPPSLRILGCADELELVTREREQKAERHLEAQHRWGRNNTTARPRRPGLTGCAASQKADGARRLWNESLFSGAPVRDGVRRALGRGRRAKAPALSSGALSGSFTCRWRASECVSLSARISANAGVVQQCRRWWYGAKSLKITKPCNARVARTGLQNRGLQVGVLPGLSERSTLAPSCFAARAFVPWNSARLSV